MSLMWLYNFLKIPFYVSLRQGEFVWIKERHTSGWINGICMDTAGTNWLTYLLYEVGKT